MKDELIKLYDTYRLKLEKESDNYLVFSYRIGFFRNIEIVKLENTYECDKEVHELESEYKALGWNSISIAFYQDVQEAADKLFKSFFYLEESQSRLKNEYEAFCRYQTEKLRSTYEYIDCVYNESTEEHKSLVDYIMDSAEENKPRLIILEAAAGYGKTCTVYQILYKLLERCPQKLPLFIELSKNRIANIFLQVLQNESNKMFPQLSDELVDYEIKNGKIPLIIDGFDELIQWKNSIDELDNPDEQSLSMLSTIADMLKTDSKAWVLLTTRRSAIFTGDVFEEWVEKRLGQECIVERLQILKPSVREWIGEEKYNYVISEQIPIENLSNPVLLTLIRDQTIDEVKAMAGNSDEILSKYLELLLEREQLRQLINLETKELYSVMERLASCFVQYDIIAESREFIDSLLSDILEGELMKYRLYYRETHGNDIGMLTREAYINRISNNSLLDRVSANSNQIGFINEFILGILVGDAVLDELLDSADLSEKFLDISTTAYMSRCVEKKSKYYKCLQQSINKYTAQCRLNVEINLLDRNNSNYNNVYFDGLYFRKEFEFSSDYTFVDCIFSSCIFDNCTIDAQTFENSKFFNCQFFDVNVKGDPKENIFLGCTGYEALQNKERKTYFKQENVDQYEKKVLEQFWKPGYHSAELRRTYRALFKGVPTRDNPHIEIALKSLLKKKILKELNVCYELNTEKMEEINIILGRENN